MKFISTKLSTGKRVQELETIRLAIEKKVNLMNYLKEEMKNTYNITIPDVGYETIQNILTQNFATGTGKDTYKDIKIIDEHNNISPNFSKLLLNHEFKRQILEVVDYAIDQYKKEYSERYKDTDLCLYKKYTYEDVCQLLNWEKVLFHSILVVINMMNTQIHCLFSLIMIKRKIYQIRLNIQIILLILKL